MCLVLGLAGAALPAYSRPPFRVFEPENDVAAQRQPDVASDGEGNFVVVWEEPRGGAASRIRARRFDRGGEPRDERELAVPTVGDLEQVAVAAHRDGGFAVVWRFDEKLRAVQLDSEGDRLPGREVLVAGQGAGAFDAAALPNGELVVVWLEKTKPNGPLDLRSESAADCPRPALVGRRFDGPPGGGDPHGRFEIACGVALDTAPSIAVLEDPAEGASLLVLWEGEADDPFGDVLARAVDLSTGVPVLQGVIRVNQVTAGRQSRPAVAALGSRDLAVAWESVPSLEPAENPTGSGIFARALVGGRVGPEIQVNSRVEGDQISPELAFDPEGSWLVTWEDRERGRIAAQTFDPAGFLAGGEVNVDTRRARAREVRVSSRPRVAPLGGGRFVVVWEERFEADGSDARVWARLLEPGRSVRPLRIPRGAEWRAPVTSVER
jgi:hypothetical protein